MHIIHVAILLLGLFYSCNGGYVVPMCLEDGDVCAEKIGLAFPGFSFYTQFCLTSPEVEDSAVSHMFCTFYDMLGRVTDMVSSSIKCVLNNEGTPKPETYFEIMVEYFGLEHLIEKKQKKTCVEELFHEHHMTAIYTLLFLTSIGAYYTFFVRKAKKLDPSEQLTFINKFERGDDEEDIDSSKDDKSSSVLEHEDAI